MKSMSLNGKRKLYSLNATTLASTKFQICFNPNWSYMIDFCVLNYILIVEDRGRWRGLLSAECVAQNV